MLPETAARLIDDVIATGGPDTADYAELQQAIGTIHRQAFDTSCAGVVSVRVAENCMGPIVLRHRSLFMTTATNQGFARLKPHGYAGDFEIIERMYNQTISQSETFTKWDRLFQSSQCVTAVRKRAEVLVEVVKNRDSKSVLSVGCGPGIDVRNLLEKTSSVTHVTLLDNDNKAIERSRANLCAHSDVDMDYICRNAFRFKSNRKFDVIWSAGLFDYLSDKAFTVLAKRLSTNLNPGGVMVLGNFGPDHQTRAYMEVVGDWFLIHRTEAELRKLAEAIDAKQADITNDETGANLFITLSF